MVEYIGRMLMFSLEWIVLVMVLLILIWNGEVLMEIIFWLLGLLNS